MSIDITYTLIERDVPNIGDNQLYLGTKLYSIIEEASGHRNSKNRLRWEYSIRAVIEEAEMRGKRYTYITDDSTSLATVLATAKSIEMLKLEFPYEYLT